MLVFVLILTLLALACNGDNDDPNRVLNLKNWPYTEEQLRAEIRTAFVEGRDVLDLLCRASDFSDDETVMDLTEELLVQGRGATVEPGPDDVERVTEVIREECFRRSA